MDQPPAILVVDDDETNRRLARRVLEAAGWRVAEAAGGADAVAAAREQPVALILMDIQMPEVDGFAAARAIRAGGGAGCAVPIVAFTAMPPGDTIGRARAAGMDGHVAKPFTPETLLAAVAPWHPGGLANPAASLAAIFGAAEIAALLARFRAQLRDALEADEDDGARRGRAHRIAGISGTLGFAEVSRTWLAVSEGDAAAWPDACAAARRALAATDAAARPIQP